MEHNAHRIYISGPMTGLPEFNFPAFFAAEVEFSALGFVVMNPARMPQGLDYAEYMRLDLVLLSMCTDIAMLPGWQRSKGARAELAYALSLGLKVHGLSHGELAAFAVAA